MNAQLIAFLVIVVLFLGMTARASRVNRTTDAHYVAFSRVPSWQNGLAITGEFASAASFLGISGGIALAGYDAFYLAIGVPLGFLLLLLIVAEPMRRSGRYTVADMLAARFPARAVRMLVAATTIVITVLYMIAQFVGAGALLHLLFGIEYGAAVVIIGALMTIIVLAGGMIAATHVQAIKTVGLFIATGILLVLVFGRLGWNPLNVFAEAVSSYGPAAVAPMHPPPVAGIDKISLVLAIALGTAGLPHIMIRFLTVRDARAARRSALITCWLMAVYLVGIVLVGYGAAVLVGRGAIADANPAGTLAALQLSMGIGGNLVQAIIAGITFAIIVAALAGLVIAASGAVANDLYANVIKKGQVSQRGQLLAARMGALVACVVALLLAFGARTLNLAFLGGLAFGVAASTTLPVILFGLYWRRFNATGAICGLAAGLVASLVALLLGPNVMGAGALFPLGQPALVTVPIGFLAAVAGTVFAPRARGTRRPVAVSVE